MKCTQLCLKILNGVNLAKAASFAHIRIQYDVNAIPELVCIWPCRGRVSESEYARKLKASRAEQRTSAAHIFVLIFYPAAQNRSRTVDARLHFKGTDRGVSNNTRGGPSVNSALALAARNPEVALLSPGDTPAVLDNPAKNGQGHT